MSSHGVFRGQGNANKDEASRAREQVKIKEYNTLAAQVQDLKSKNDYSPTSLSLTSKLLSANPEFNTIWNYRRRILLSMLNNATTREEKSEIIANDLSFLLPLLIKFPKCYWIWGYRVFLLQQANVFLDPKSSLKFWQGELALIAKMFSRDARNFHGWGYRRMVVREIELLRQNTDSDNQERQEESKKEEEGKGGTDSDTKEGKQDGANDSMEEEFAFTTAMYERNMSNYSAWHQRTKIIPRLLDRRCASTLKRRKFLDDELDTMKTALYTDPFDQSIHLYHHWLVHAVCAAQSSSTTDPSSMTASSPVTETTIDPIIKLSLPAKRNLLRSEIAWMKELLDEEPECRLLIEELASSTMLLRRLRVIKEHAADTQTEDNSDEYEQKEEDTQDEKFELDEIRAWLEKLIKIDPLRRGRWREILKRTV